MNSSFWADTVVFTPILLDGAWTTVLITFSALILSTFLGLFWAIMRVSHINRYFVRQPPYRTHSSVQPHEKAEA
jgi:ABC-type amino acid transport system permease subunit